MFTSFFWGVPDPTIEVLALPWLVHGHSMPWSFARALDSTSGWERAIYNDLLGGGFTCFLYFHLFLGKISILTHIFQMG